MMSTRDENSSVETNSDEITDKVENDKDNFSAEQGKLESKIPPKPISEQVSHRLALVEVGPARYKMIRCQKKRLPRALADTQKKYGISDMNKEGVVKIWEDLPHAVDTCNAIKDLFRKHTNTKVIGDKQIIEWKGDVQELHGIIEAYLNKRGGGTRVALAILGQTSITDYFPRNGAASTSKQINN
uniref:Uncharacterized protein n=1 Tax=Homalodisca liturata TaxID=320908 RepID=A0A1B6IRS8_9HEMI